MPVAIPVGAELDERSATAVAERARRVFTEAGRDAGRSFSESFTNGARDSEQALKKIGDKASDAYDKATDAAGKLRAEEERLAALRERGARNDQIVAQAERVEKARRAEVRAVRDATDAMRDYEKAAEDAGRNGGQSFLAGLSGSSAGVAATGQDMANEFVGGFAGASMLTRLGTAGGPIGIALAAAATLGVVAGRQLAAGIVEGLATIQLQDQFQAAMGLDESAMGRYADAAGRAYANNFGLSVQDNLATAQVALQAGLIDTGSTDAEVQGVISQVQSIAGITGATAAELSRSVTTLMRTGFAGSVTEALDIITAGFQDGLDVSNDWLDSINEYSTQFRKLGLDTSEWMTLLKQGLEGGARDTDKVADSLKEFSIRAVDGSKLTAEGFAALGFNADEMGRRFAEGGESARTAFAMVLDALRATDDAQQQALIWTALFGTQFEDMGDAINSLSLDPVKAEFRDITGTSTEATKTATDNFKSEWEAATRAVSQAFTNLKTDIAEFFSSLPVIGDLPRWLTTVLGDPGSLEPGAPGVPAIPYGPAVVTPGPAVSMPGASPTTNPNPLDVFGGNAPNQAFPADGSVDYKTLYPDRRPAQDPAAPTPGERTPILTDSQAEAAKEAEKAAKEKFSAPPDQWALDSVPLGSFPGEEGLAGVPGLAPGVPMPGVPSGAQGPGHYEVDQQRVFDAETSRINAQTSLQNARFKYLEVMADADATEQDKYNAKRSLITTGRALQSAEAKLAEAQQGTWKKMESAAKGFTSGMGEIGAALDSDLGISEGLPGLADNLVRFVASLAAAPLLGPLSAISAANPIQGGHGILGVLGAQGAFGPQYTQSQYAQSGYAAAGPVAMQPGYAGGQPYGLPAGSNSGGYGGAGVQFPPWVRAIEQAFNVKASTYGGHQTDNRNEPGYAPNPRGENRGIDWVGSVDAMQRLADYLAAMPGALEQVIWQNPNTGRSTEIAGGRHQPGYFSGDLAGHRDHVHTRQSQALPVPSGVAMPTAGANWNAIAQKESSGNWQANTGNGYYGGLQFLPSSWEAAGGTQYAPRADMASPGQQVATAENLLAMQGPGAWPNTFVPASPGGAGGSGIGFPGMGGPPQSVITPGVGGMAFPSQGGGGFDGVGGLPMDAIMTATQGLDMLAPGASQAAQIGIKLANRAIGYAGQVAGIGVSGLMETFLPSGSPLGNIGNSWFGKLAAGFAGARPALPNVAGQQAPPNPNAPQPGQPGQQQPGQPVQVEYHNHEATEDRAGADLARHLEANAAPTGVR